MIHVSGAPRFPEPAPRDHAVDDGGRTLGSGWTEMRARHVHGDDQIRALWRHARGFADDRQDMNFDVASLSAITARVLVVHGDRDPLYPMELAVELYRAIPASTLWVVPNGGHGPIFGEQARAFAMTATAFLGGAG
jgi:pimeloyl-ACP methyl ester carboxylesterase